ncbi:tigger transposable element-derived protein 1-like [Penaeus indicus]|uniref:tigger transposable element-derived protein 1-like n=1 Tax=Penaeus indicus TaxID=29960 RepID=UPI00300C89B0
MIIQEKALSLFNELKAKYGEDVTFTASHGWFNRFRARNNLHNVKVSGEAASADIRAAEEFPGKLAEVIHQGGYTPQQIFNMDETGLYWKRMPDRTYISTEKTMPGFKAAKDRLMLLLRGNASDDLKLKPLLVYTAENPRALKNIAKSSLPVVWKNDFHPNVKVVYLPLNTTSLIQPMDQGVIATFKKYLRHTFRQALKVTDETDMTLSEFWKSYNIYNAIININASWWEVTTTCMNAVWKKLCPQVVNDFTGFENIQKEQEVVVDNLISMSEKLELELQEQDFTEFFDDRDKDQMKNYENWRSRGGRSGNATKTFAN